MDIPAIKADKYSKAIVILATPLQRVAAGGFIRSAKIMPYAVASLKESDIESIIIVPASSLIGALNLLLRGGKDFDESVELIIKDLYSLKKINSLNTDIVDESIQRFIQLSEQWRRQRSYVLEKIIGFGYVYMKKISLFEAPIIDYANKYIATSYDKTVFAYSMHESNEFILLLSSITRRLRTKGGVLLQSSAYACPRTLFSDYEGGSPFPLLSSLQFNCYIRKVYSKMAENRMLRLVQAVSPAPLIESCDLVKILKENKVPMRIVIPGIALESDVNRYRNIGEKNKTAVYFGRIGREKGLYDLLFAWHFIEKLDPEATLRIIGSFNSERDEALFASLVKSLRLRNVEYLGYVPRGKELYSLVSSAKVLMYPSYRDAHPFVLLESLALGLISVAYDIPAVKYLYRNVPAVFRVKVGDVKGLAQLTHKALNMRYSEYLELVDNPRTRNFVYLHSSWERVAISEFKSILKIIHN